MTEFQMPEHLTAAEIRRRLATPAPQERPRKLLTPGEVADVMHVDPKTVTRWAKAGKLTSFRTLGGHRRYDANEVQDLIDGTREDRRP